MTPTPSINKVYAMIISEESRRSINSPILFDNPEGITLFSNTKGNSRLGHGGGRAGVSGNNYPGGGRGGSGTPNHYSDSYANRPRRSDVVCE